MRESADQDLCLDCTRGWQDLRSRASDDIAAHADVFRLLRREKFIDKVAGMMIRKVVL